MVPTLAMDRQQLENLLTQDSRVHSVNDVLLRLRGKATWRVEPMEAIQRRAPDGLEILTTYVDGVAYCFSRVGRKLDNADLKIGNPFREYVLHRNNENQGYVVADFRNDYDDSQPRGV